MAAHIAAAATGGPRHSADMSSAERSAIENAIWLCQTCAKLVDNDEKRFTAEVLRGWRTKRETAALKAIGKTATRKKVSALGAERRISRDLKIKARLEKALLKPIEERRQLKPDGRPTRKFRTSKLVVRSLEDTKYPEVDVKPPSGISSWLVFEPYNFYHGGLMVILNIRLAALYSDGDWAYVDYRLDVPEDTPGIAKVWVLGEIPWRNIREINPDGDEYYPGAHLFCAYANDGMPYERIVARIIGDDYDEPLDPEKQRPDLKTLEKNTPPTNR